MKIIARLLRWLFGIRHPYGDVLNHARARGLLLAAWLFAALMLGNLLLQISTPTALTSRFGIASVEQTQVVFATIYGLFVSMALLCVVMLKIGRLYSAALIFTALLFVVAVVGYLASGLNSYMMVVFSAPLIAAAVFLDRRALLGMGTLIVVTVLGLHLLDSVGALLNLDRRAAGLAVTVLSVASVLLLDGVMLLALMTGAETARKKLMLRTDEVRSLGRFTQSILGARRLETALTDGVETIREQLGYYHAQIFLIEEQTGLVLLRAASGMSEMQVLATRRRISGAEAHPVNEVLRTAEVVRVDMGSPEELRAEFLPTTRSEALVPLTYGNTVTGVLDVHSIQPDSFTDADIEVLHMIAAELALVVHNAHLISKLQDNNRSRRTLEEQLQDITSQRHWKSERQHGEVANRQTVGRMLQNRLGQTVGFDWRNGMVSPTTELSAIQLQAIRDAMPSTYEQDGEHILTVPINLRGVPLGVMEFRNTHHAGWSSRQIDLARVIAQRLALALDNLNLFEQAQITANREQIASQLSAQLQTRTDLESLVALATESFQRALGAARAEIRLGIPPDRTDTPSASENGGSTNGNGNGNGSSAHA